ncbi:riboflavin kinase, partial [Arthrospira platensis SPKY1]|nr:riboflavin kinase [Arthrospira platensis SPKY1]
DGEAISSSRIRESLKVGDFKTVNTLLGYNFSTAEKVISGKKLGRTLGFPTLNLPCDLPLPPPYGVYHVRAKGVTGTYVPAIANFGLRPSVESTQIPLLEVHLLQDHCPFNTGDFLEVEWLQFIRPEMKFESVEALKRQISLDCQAPFPNL